MAEIKCKWKMYHLTSFEYEFTPLSISYCCFASCNLRKNRNVFFFTVYIYHRNIWWTVHNFFLLRNITMEKDFNCETGLVKYWVIKCTTWLSVVCRLVTVIQTVFLSSCLLMSGNLRSKEWMLNVRSLQLMSTHCH